MFYSFTVPYEAPNFQFISLEFQSKTIENKKYITTEGEVYFKKDNNLMVTHIKKPFESITIVNADGDMKIYDIENNTLMLSSNVLNSSKYSYLWHFFTNNFQDMGLSKYGYIIKNTKTEEGVFVIEWVPPFNNTSSLYKIILAKENNLPIYQEF